MVCLPHAYVMDLDWVLIKTTAKTPNDCALPKISLSTRIKGELITIEFVHLSGKSLFFLFEMQMRVFAFHQTSTPHVHLFM